MVSALDGFERKTTKKNVFFFCWGSVRAVRTELEGHRSSHGDVFNRLKADERRSPSSVPSTTQLISEIPRREEVRKSSAGFGSATETKAWTPHAISIKFDLLAITSCSRRSWHEQSAAQKCELERWQQRERREEGVEMNTFVSTNEFKCSGTSHQTAHTHTEAASVCVKDMMAENMRGTLMGAC